MLLSHQSLMLLQNARVSPADPFTRRLHVVRRSKDLPGLSPGGQAHTIIRAANLQP